MESSPDVHPTPLGSNSVAHVGIVIQPAGDDGKNRPLIIGRQSPQGPIPPLQSAIAAL